MLTEEPRGTLSRDLSRLPPPPSLHTASRVPFVNAGGCQL